MSALFPSFLSLGKRIERLLATDIKSIWQAIEESREPTGQPFFDGFIYHPPIVYKQCLKTRQQMSQIRYIFRRQKKKARVEPTLTN